MTDPDAGADDAPGTRPIFVERHTYRRRRMRDAARALPALGVLLWMVPLLWVQSGEAMRASRALVYLFGVWVSLALISALLIAALNRGDRDAMRSGHRGGDDAP